MFILVAIAGFMIGFEATANFGELFTVEPPEPGAAISAGITAVVGSYIVGATITADVGRFARKRHHPAIGWAVHVLFLMPLLLIGAAIMTLTTGELDFAQAMLASGMGLGVFIMVIFGFWTTNDNNLYSGALAWSVFLPLEKRVIVALQAIVGIAIASYVGFSSGVSMAPLISFLEILGITVPAIAGVIIADFYLYRWWAEGSLDERYAYEVGQKFGLFVWPGWVAALVGIGIGGFLLEGVFIGALNVLLIAGVLHVVLMVATDVLGIPAAIGQTSIDETGRSPEVLQAMPGGGHLRED
ncbi:MAG: cytosine permease, partial [Halobacteriota archaeon]